LQPIIPTSKQLLRSSISSVLRSIIHAFVLFVVYPIYINNLGTEIFGVWVMVGVIIGWSQIGSLGIPQTIMKFAAGAAAKGNKKELIEYVSSSLTVILFSGIMILFLLFIVKDTIVNIFQVPLTIKLSMPLYVILAGLIVVVSFIAQTINGILSGIGRMDIANINDITGKIIGSIVSVALILKGYGIFGLLIGSMSECVIILVVASIISILSLGFNPYNIKFIKKGRIKETVFFGGTLSISSLFAMFLEPFNRFILGQYVGLSTATVYDVASRVVSQVRGILEAAFRSFVPQSSVYYSMGYKNKLRDMSNRSVSFICIFGVPILLTLIIWSPELISMWLRIEMQDITYAVRIIAFSSIFSLMVSPAYYLFIGIGNNYICFCVYIILSMLNFILVLLSLLFGYINLKLVVNIFSLSLLISSLYLMRESYMEFGERYLLNIRNMYIIVLFFICMSLFKIIGVLCNFQNMMAILLILFSFILYFVICYVFNLIPVNYIKSHMLSK